MTSFNSNLLLPRLTLSVYCMSVNTTRQAITMALEFGYRSFDIALYYRNEAAVGEAICQFGIN